MGMNAERTPDEVSSAETKESPPWRHIAAWLAGIAGTITALGTCIGAIAQLVEAFSK